MISKYITYSKNVVIVGQIISNLYTPDLKTLLADTIARKKRRLREAFDYYPIILQSEVKIERFT